MSQIARGASAALANRDITVPTPLTAEATRIASIDIFRGLTILVMVFVNDVSGVKGLPWWTYHMPENRNGMTYVDMVFPAFLFIVGMSIPLAIRRRIAKGDTPFRIWRHTILRSIGLVAMGLLLANQGYVDAQLTGINAWLWDALALAGIILFWNVYPRSGRFKPLFVILKWTGLALLVWSVIIFKRRTQQGQVTGLDFSYLEILGLIGCAYFSVCILYLILKKNFWVFVFSLSALTALNVASKIGLTPRLDQLPNYVWPFETGALSSITMAGLVASLMFFENTVARTFKAKAAWALGFAAILLGAAWELAPLGISKNLATPTWCLYSAGVSLLLFLILYWVADVRHATKWASFVKPAGSNTLLTYLLPYVCYLTPVVNRISAYGSEGRVGVVRAVVFTGFVLALSAVVTRLHLRLQL